MKIKFCHIAPTAHLRELTTTNGAHLILAHLVEEDKEYREFYRNCRGSKILDNSAFEMFQAKKPMYSSSKLIEMGIAAKADYIVLSDYPNRPGLMTIDAARSLIPQFKDAGFKTFFVPQSTEGALEDYLDTFAWALENKDIDLIGVSIIGAPNAFGVLANLLQRGLSRWAVMRMLEKRGLLKEPRDHKRLHFLGLLDGPSEISLVKPWERFIYSWDSSCAVVLGLNDQSFDSSPTGMMDGKYLSPMDFSAQASKSSLDMIEKNINYLNGLL